MITVNESHALVGRMTEEIGKVYIGQKEVVREVLVCLLAGGHILIEGVPGLGKTLLVRALAQTFGGKDKRIQFTPDLMPTDVTGHAIYNMKEERFEVRRGPVFTNLLLADEINRAPAKTQSALLEVMQEQQVTIEGRALTVSQPFMVLATQNPIEQDGTYPLPEAELDRFMMKTVVDYPAMDEEVELVRLQTQDRVAGTLSTQGVEAVVDAEGLVALREAASTVVVDDAVMAYAVNVVRATREFVGINQGASPRATIAIVAAGRAQALCEGRDFVTPDDVKRVLLPVLRHRVQLSPDREIEGAAIDEVLTELIARVEAPRL